MDNESAVDVCGDHGVVRSIPKVSTGIRGLDDILMGGLPEGQVTVAVGGPGAGKSIFGLEFAYRSACAGEPAIFVSFEERADILRRNAISLGWDLAAMEKNGMLFLIDSRPAANMVRAGDFDLTGLLAVISGQAGAMGARRLVIDSIDVLLRIFDDPFRERNQLHFLADWLSERGLTTLLTTRELDVGFAKTHQFLEYMTDCLVRLDIRIVGQIATRRLRVLKYRGSAFGSNEYPCVITGDGIYLLPISKMNLRQKVLEHMVTSGISGVDGALGGGYWWGSSVMVAGGSGIGKTTFLCTFVRGASGRGERVLYVNFEESAQVMVGNMQKAGIDLQPALTGGTLRMLTGLPEAMGAEEHLVRILKAIEMYQPDHVVVDAVSATLRIGSRQAAFEFLMRLISTCKEQGRTCLVSNQDSGRSRVEDYGAHNISTLMDTILLLRYVDDVEEVKRLLFVLKSRGMPQSSKYHEYRITDSGIDIIGPYVARREFNSSESPSTIEGDER